MYYALYGGTGPDNPEKVNALGQTGSTAALTNEQRAKSVVAIYQQFTEIKFTVDVSCDENYPGNNACQQRGRNFLFTGKPTGTNVLDICPAPPFPPRRRRRRPRRRRRRRHPCQARRHRRRRRPRRHLQHRHRPRRRRPHRPTRPRRRRRRPSRRRRLAAAAAAPLAVAVAAAALAAAALAAAAVAAAADRPAVAAAAFAAAALAAHALAAAVAAAAVPPRRARRRPRRRRPRRRRRALRRPSPRRRRHHRRPRRRRQALRRQRRRRPRSPSRRRRRRPHAPKEPPRAPGPSPPPSAPSPSPSAPPSPAHPPWRPAQEYKPRDKDTTGSDAAAGLDGGPHEFYSYEVTLQLLLPNRYSRLDKGTTEEKDTVSRGDSVFQYHSEDDDPTRTPDDPHTVDVNEFTNDPADDDISTTSDPELVGDDGRVVTHDYTFDDGSTEKYIDPRHDRNHQKDRKAEEATVGADDNGNGGILLLPTHDKSGGTSTFPPTILVPGTGTAWIGGPPPSGPPSPTGVPPALTEYTGTEAETTLTQTSLKDRVDDPDNVYYNPDDPLGQSIDPSTINRVVPVDLTPGVTYKPGGESGDEHNDGVDELIVCTTHGAFLIRSTTDSNGVTKYDPPVRLGDSTEDVRDAATMDFNGDGYVDIVVVTGPHSPDRVYLGDGTDPLMETVGGGPRGSVDQTNPTPREPGDLDYVELQRPAFKGTSGSNNNALVQYDNDGVDPDDPYTDSTSVVTVATGVPRYGDTESLYTGITKSPPGAGLEDLIIVGQRARVKPDGTGTGSVLFYCCDSPVAYELVLPDQMSAGTANTPFDVLDIDTAVLGDRRPSSPPTGTGGSQRDYINEPMMTTVVLGTTSSSEKTGAKDLYFQIKGNDKKDANGDVLPDDVGKATGGKYETLAAILEALVGVTGKVADGDLNTGNVVHDLQKPDSLDNDDNVISGNVAANAISGQNTAHSTHTVRFVDVPQTAVAGELGDGGGANALDPTDVRAHLYLGYYNQGNMLSTDEKTRLGDYYAAPTDTTIGSDVPTGIRKRAATGTKIATSTVGMDVAIADPNDPFMPPTVLFQTNGGSVLTFDPFREDVDGDVTTFASPERKLYYDGDRLDAHRSPDAKYVVPGADPANGDPVVAQDFDDANPQHLKVGLLKTDGTRKDLTSNAYGADSATAIATGNAEVDAMRDAEANAGIVLAADLDGDGYPDVVSGRYVVLNTDQDGVFDSEPLEYWTYGPTPRSVVATDVDGDGDLDLVCAPHNNADADTNKEVLVVLYNDGSGSFGHRKHNVNRNTADAGGTTDTRKALRDALRVGGANGGTGTAISARNVLRVAAGHLNSGPDVPTNNADGRADLVVTKVGGGADVYYSDLDTTDDLGDAHTYAAHKETRYADAVTVATGGAEVVDVLVTSLTGAQGGTRDALKEHPSHPERLPPPDDILLLTVDKVYVVANVANVYPFNPSIATAVTTIDLDVDGGTRGEAQFIAVGNLFGDAARSLPRRDADSPTPMLHPTGQPVEVDGYIRNTDQTGTGAMEPTLGQRDNRGELRNAALADYRTLDLVVVMREEDANDATGATGQTRIYALAAVEGHYGGANADGLISTPNAGTIAQKRYPTSTSGTVFKLVHELHASTDGTLDRTDAIVSALQVKDLDGNGLDDIVLAFRAGTKNGESAKEIYRSVLYTYDQTILDAVVYDTGGNPETTNEPHQVACAADPTGALNPTGPTAACGGYGGARLVDDPGGTGHKVHDLDDLQIGGDGPTQSASGNEWVEVVLASSAASGGLQTGSDATKRDAAHTAAMVVADLDSDGRYDILYGTDTDEAARTSLARPNKALAHVATANPASVTDLNNYDELPLDVQAELNAIKSSFLGMLDAMLASHASAATVTDTDIPSANALYPGETEMGVVNRGNGVHPGQNDNYTPHMRPAKIRCEACSKDAKEAYVKAAGDGKGIGSANSCIRIGFISDPASSSDLTALAACCGPLDCGYYGRQHNEEGEGGNDYLSNPNDPNGDLAEVDGTGILSNPGGGAEVTPETSLTCPATGEPVLPIEVSLQVDFASRHATSNHSL